MKWVGAIYLSERNEIGLHVSRGLQRQHIGTWALFELMRIHGKLRRMDMPDLNPTETKQLAYSVLTDAQKHRFEENLELDFSFGLKNLARFRANLFNQRGAVGAVFRTIPSAIRTLDDLRAPTIFKDISMYPRGLVLVTGPTGSGKTTTLYSALA